jgi:hypothetical protein
MTRIRPEIKFALGILTTDQKGIIIDRKGIYLKNDLKNDLKKDLKKKILIIDPDN